MHTVVLTCAGRSTRFPNHRPKWSLTHPSGDMMAVESIAKFPRIQRLVAAFNSKDVSTFGVDNIEHELKYANAAVIDIVDVGESPTHVETIRRAIKLGRVQGAFTAKDCDNQFEYTLADGDFVAVASLMSVGKVDASNKGYVEVRGNFRLLDIEERTMLSEWFCCGAYSFADAERFYVESEGDSRVSDYIKTRMADFEARPVQGYVDWGTAEDWLAYVAQFKTLFVDIDGVLVESSHRSFAPVWGESPVIQANIDYLNRLHATGKVEVVLTTSRPEEYRLDTIAQLSGLTFDRLIMGLRNCGRYLVNDYVSKRGEHTCFAINVERDSELLEQALGRLR